MPSLMIHLLTAYKYNPKASTAFWIGNIAPDSVSERNEKDKSHFRDKPNRLYILRELALTINLSDDFSKGILLHLFLDYYWDSFPMRDFIENYNELINVPHLYRSRVPLRFSGGEHMSSTSLKREDVIKFFYNRKILSEPMRYKEDDWFPIYRQEIALAGGWLYHHKKWSKTVWDEMIAYPISEYGNVHGIIKEKVADMIIRNSKWHAESNIGPSSVFPPDFVEEFTTKVAIDFKNWLEDI